MIPYFTFPTFHLGPLDIAAFGALVCTGFLVGTHLAMKRAEKVGLSPVVVNNLSLICLVAGLIGAHLTHIFAYHPDKFWSDPWSILKIWSGISSFGGFVGAGIVIWIYLKKQKIPFFPYADVMMFGLFPGWLFGRLGCFTAHDHPGKLTSFFLAVKYPEGTRHDLGFYEVLLSFIWIPLVYFLGRKNKVDEPKSGTIYAAMIFAYSLPRFFLDFLRADDLSFVDARYFGYTPAQYVCAFMVLYSAYLFYRLNQDK